MKCKCPKCNKDIKFKKRFIKNGLTIIEKQCDRCGYFSSEPLDYIEMKLKYPISRTTGFYSYYI